MKIGRGTRIFGMTILFALPVAIVAGHWRYAGAATWAVAAGGVIAGEI